MGVFLTKSFCRFAAAVLAASSCNCVSKAHAADLGGDCCDDLEERIADFESTTGQKGNRKVSLIVSGWVGQQILAYDLTISRGSFELALPGLALANIVTPNSVYAIQGSRLAVVDTSSLVHELRMSRSVVRAVDQAVSGAMNGSLMCAAPAVDDASQSSAQCSRSGLWATGIGGASEIDGTASAFSADQSMVGGLAGGHTVLSPGLSVGIFGGYARSDLETEFDAEQLDTDYGIAGVYGRARTGSLFADFGLTGLWSNADRARDIATNAPGSGGFASASASYDGWVVVPSASLGWRVPVHAGTTVIPALKVKGQIGRMDGYTETGPVATLTVGGRDIEDVEGRVEIGFEHVFAVQGGLSGSAHARVGMSYLRTFADDQIDGVLLGQAVTLSGAASDNEFGGYVGLVLILC